MASPEDTLVIETSKGRVTVEMRPDLAPNHVARIKELARQGFYDGVVFHRVIDGMENVDKINRGEPPANPDKMLTVRVAADLA
jgi:cyclophilin family peptidyl-prolyl cis-trans isomerase